MTEQNSTQTSPTGQPAPKHLSDRQALELGRLAIAAILYGDPPFCTFDRADLKLALSKLGHLQIALEADRSDTPPWGGQGGATGGGAGL